MLRQKSLVFAALLVFANAMHCAETTQEDIKHSKKKSSWYNAVFSTRTALEFAAFCLTVYTCKSMFHEPSLSTQTTNGKSYDVKQQAKIFNAGRDDGIALYHNALHNTYGIQPELLIEKICLELDIKFANRKKESIPFKSRTTLAIFDICIEALEESKQS